MSERFVTSDGLRLWAAEGGEGPPVLLGSGGPGCCDYLGPVAAMIADLARVIRYDPRGCGRSEPAPAYDLESCLADLENIRRACGFDRWIVGGHSWGADLALIYALEHPDRTAGLICLAGGRVHNDREWHQTYQRRKQAGGERVPEFEYPPNQTVNEQVNRAWRRYIQDPTLFRRISRLAAPAIFIYGEQDIRPSWPVEQVANLMPNARFERVAGAAHYLWLARPDELRRLLRAFIAAMHR
jgi:proline iminopeptidase